VAGSSGEFTERVVGTCAHCGQPVQTMRVIELVPGRCFRLVTDLVHVDSRQAGCGNGETAAELRRR
jgi:hypothetical protein